MGVHESAGALEAGLRNVRSATQQCADPLIVDGVRPFCTVQVRCREFEYQIAQRRRVQDGGVEKCHGDRQRSIAHIEFLGVGCKIVECPAPSRIGFVLVAEDVLKAYAPVRPDLAEGDGAPFEQPD